jgi:hypothetical protein
MSINHALLPSISQATLPEKYEAAKLALTECNRIDECKDWSDKAMALASYARQSEDKEMENTAIRIRARAMRRAGVLLQEVEDGKGKHWKSKRGGEAPSTRKAAGHEAGMSDDQIKDAVRVANVDDDSFEEQIESDEPPTITALAEQGKGKANGVPPHVQRGISIKAFQAGMYFQGALTTFAKRIQEFDPQDVADGSTEKERLDIRRNIQTITEYLDQLIPKL